MNIITKDISLDVARENLYQPVIAKQYDQHSRFLKVRLLNEGVPIDVDKSATVIISAERADEQAKSFAGEVNDDGTVTVPITNWMLELDDEVRCDVSVIDIKEQTKLTSTSFTIEVQLAANGNGEISGDPNYDILVKLIGDYQKAKNECDTATNKAKEATDSAIKAAESASKWENVTVTVEMLDASEQAAVTVTDTETGKQMHIKFPRGQTGLTPNLKIGKVETGAPGTDATASISGTAENPVLNLTVPRGDAGSVKSWNGIEPDETGDVKAEIGGRNLIPDTRNMRGFSKANSVSTYVDNEGFTVASFTPVSPLEWNYVNQLPPIRFSSVKNKTVTFSLEVKSDQYEPINQDVSQGLYVTFALTPSANSSTRIRYKGVSMFGVRLTDTWQKVAITVKLTDDFFSSGEGVIDNAAGFKMEVFNRSVYSMELRKFKLELGSVSTDWTPAFEDFMSESTTLELAAVELHETLLQKEDEITALELMAVEQYERGLELESELATRSDLTDIELALCELYESKN